jgi:hypothetical protein
MATGIAVTGTSRGKAADGSKAAAGADVGSAGATGVAGLAIAGGAGAIVAGTDGATPGTQAGISSRLGTDDSREVPPNMLARLASEVSDARKNAACDSAMARWKTAWASAVWRWLS